MQTKDAYREHGFAVTLFSELLKEGTANAVSGLFTPQRISSSSPLLTVRSHNYAGYFLANPEYIPDKDWWKADRYHFYGQDPQANNIFF